MTTIPRPLLAFTVLLTAASAQDQATTLAAACQRADVIAVATVTATSDPSPAWHRLEWRVGEVLKGDLGTTLTLLEPAGACCGRSLFALTTGQRCLLLLRRTGPLLHPFGGHRGVLAPTPAVLEHVRALLGATSPAARARLLARSLDHQEPRVAHDAAHALAAMPALALAADDRARVAAALRVALVRGQTSAAPLVECVVRCADAAMIDAVLPLYLDEPHGDRARLLRAGFQRVRPELLTERLPLHVAVDDRRQQRAAELVRQLPGEHGVTAMRTLLTRTDSPRAQLQLAEGLLAEGVPPAALRRDVPAPVLELAVRRSARADFRAIRPDRR